VFVLLVLALMQGQPASRLQTTVRSSFYALTTGLCLAAANLPVAEAATCAAFAAIIGLATFGTARRQAKKNPQPFGAGIKAS